MASWPNPSARSEPLAQRAARRRGCRFLWLLSFGQAKESDRRPWMVDETHTDVSRFSRRDCSVMQVLPSPYPLPQAGEGKSACAGMAMCGGLRRNDGRTAHHPHPTLPLKGRAQSAYATKSTIPRGCGRARPMAVSAGGGIHVSLFHAD